MEILPLFLGLAMGLITSYTDLKIGFIDDLNVFPTLALVERFLYGSEEPMVKIPIPAVEGGIFYYLYRGLSTGSWKVALAGVEGFLVGLAIGLFLYYIGAWASGDVLILASFSALLPYPPSTARFVPPYESAHPLYPLSIFLNSILALFPFVFLYALFHLIMRKRFQELRRVFLDDLRSVFELPLWLIGGLGLVTFIARFIPVPVTIKYVFVLALTWVFSRYRLVGDILGAAYAIYLGRGNPLPVIRAYLEIFAVGYGIKIFLGMVKVIRKVALIEEVPVEELREWDILGETIFEKDGKIGRDRTDPFERLKAAMFRADPSLLKPDYGRIIASPSAEGLTKEQIEELKRLVDEGKLENRFLRKKAMPFAPAIFLGFLISYFIGDLFWLLELKLMGF